VTPEQRFWKQVVKQKNGCWIYGKRRHKYKYKWDAYGRFHVKYVNGVRIRKQAHVYSYELHYGSVPKNKWVCHSCDVPRCVNPKHLWAGTPKQNQQDSITKGRKVVCRGPLNGMYGVRNFGKDNPMFGCVGKLNPFYGKKHSVKTKRILSKKAAARIGWRHSSSTIEKMRLSALRRWRNR
jgi:HNH endonuclease/NUMOD3 motif-containing protein